MKSIIAVTILWVVTLGYVLFRKRPKSKGSRPIFRKGGVPYDHGNDSQPADDQQGGDNRFKL
jgi:hypothetical protein